MYQVVVEYRFFVFFFQAEDGIRDGTVTGVQTCALPIYLTGNDAGAGAPSVEVYVGAFPVTATPEPATLALVTGGLLALVVVARRRLRSEERRVGKECRSRWSQYH